MGRAKRTSKVLENASKRIAGLKSINANLDLGNGLNIGMYNDKINEVQRNMEAYNTALSSVDVTNNRLLNSEKELADLSERMLAGVTAKFGKDSHEYEMAGGTRKSEIKRPAKRPTSKPSAKGTD